MIDLLWPRGAAENSDEYEKRLRGEIRHLREQDAASGEVILAHEKSLAELRSENEWLKQRCQNHPTAVRQLCQECLDHALETGAFI